TRCIDRTDCHSQSPAAGRTASVNLPTGTGHYADLWWHYTPTATGSIDDVTKSGTTYSVVGWACQKTNPASVNVHLYVGGIPPAGGIFIGSYLANRASESAIATACQSTGTTYRYSIPLAATTLQQHAGKLIYLSASVPGGTGSKTILTKSGTFKVPTPPSTCGILATGASLTPGQSIKSCDGVYTLIFQGDGNVVLYPSAHIDSRYAIWATGTNGMPAATLVMQGDGNLVLYKSGVQSNATALWASGSIPPTWKTGGGTFGKPGYLAVQGDGNLVVYATTDNSVMWASNTVRSLPPSSSTAIPTATLTANGSDNIIVKVGDFINYVWSSTNGVSAASTYTVVPMDTCGSVAGPNWWSGGNTLSGSIPQYGPILACQAGRTYTVSYTVTGANSQKAVDTAIVRVRPRFTLTASPNPCTAVGTSTKCTTTISRTAPSDVLTRLFYSVGGNAPVAIGCLRGPAKQSIPWIVVGRIYTFTLYETTLCSDSITGKTPDAKVVVRGLAATAAASFTHTLARGWTGEEVSALQASLAKLGFYSGEVTGYFGPVTEAAVKSLQVQNNIAAVGILGPLTRELLQRLLGI
ncbi:MAG TPA: peptidoglycan-binding protein, partial [Candidatus Paceibacterota bacterium]